MSDEDLLSASDQSVSGHEQHIDVELMKAWEHARLDLDLHRLQTARWVAYAILGLLGLFVLGHYVVVAVAAFGGGEGFERDHLDHTFSIILPVISGLAGSAATYFFKEHGNQKP